MVVRRAQIAASKLLFDIGYKPKLYDFNRNKFFCAMCVNSEKTMSPKSDNAVSHLAEAVLTVNPPKNVQENVEKEAPVVTTTKEFQREEIFTRADRPFCIDQKKFHVVWLGTSHAFTAYYLYLLLISNEIPMGTAIFEIFYGYLGGLGITVGCHRYWTHKTFKANLPLQIILMIMQTIANQHPIHKWCLDHRIHHKYTDTDADPHNSKRGFWFSHMAWMILPKHKECEEKMKNFDMSDLESDPIVRFQSKWFWTLIAIFHWIIPMSVVYFVWNVPLLYCVAANCARYIFSLHITCSVNSFAHMWGDKPYDRNITSVENAIVSFFTVGEGFHNFHHSFPTDYRTSEFGYKLNLSTMLIDFFALIGWAYDLKTVSKKVLKDRIRRTGDGSHEDAVKEPEEMVEEAESDDDLDYNMFSADVTELMKQMDKSVYEWVDKGIPPK